MVALSQKGQQRYAEGVEGVGMISPPSWLSNEAVWRALERR